MIGYRYGDMDWLRRTDDLNDITRKELLNVGFLMRQSRLFSRTNNTIAAGTGQFASVQSIHRPAGVRGGGGGTDGPLSKLSGRPNLVEQEEIKKLITKISFTENNFPTVSIDRRGDPVDDQTDQDTFIKNMLELVPMLNGNFPIMYPQDKIVTRDKDTTKPITYTDDTELINTIKSLLQPRDDLEFLKIPDGKAQEYRDKCEKLEKMYKKLETGQSDQSDQSAQSVQSATTSTTSTPGTSVTTPTLKDCLNTHMNDIIESIFKNDKVVKGFNKLKSKNLKEFKRTLKNILQNEKFS